MSNFKDKDNLGDKASRLESEANLLRHKLQSRKVSSSDTDSRIKVISDTSKGLRSLVAGFKSALNALVNGSEFLAGLWEKVLEPIWSIISPPIKWFWRLYLRIWDRYAYTTNPDTGEKRISRVRSSVLAVLLILFLSAFTPSYLGRTVRFFTVEPVMDAATMLISKRTETFFLNHSEEIDPDLNTHAVRGCRFRGECSESDAVYFRVKPRLSHDIWKLINYGNPIYVPDHVVAPIAPGVNECVVTYYGYRMTSSWSSRLMRSLEFYPVLLETSCIFRGGENLE